MISQVEIQMLNNILTAIPKRGQFTVTRCSREINDVSQQSEINITEFLVEEGYADRVEVSPSFSVGWGEVAFESAPITLTDTGRALKELGNYGKYIGFITSEKGKIEALQKEGSQMAHRQYNVNVWIAIGASVAALYYLLEMILEILKFHFPVGIFSIVVLLFLVGAFAGYSLSQLQELIIKKYKKRKTK